MSARVTRTGPAPGHPGAPSLVLVGPGRVGRSLASWALSTGSRVLGVVGRPDGTASVGRAADELGAPVLDLRRAARADADVILLAVPETALPEIAAGLAERPPAGVVLHVSGSLDRGVLAAIEQAGGEVGSLHPLMAFPDVVPEPPGDGRLWLAVDGTAGALRAARDLGERWGGRTVPIQGDARRAYHLAASLAAGGVVTVLAVVDRIAREAGLPPEVLPAYLDLARGALDRIEELGEPTRAITGPVSRGDREVVRGHREVLGTVAPEALALWAVLGLETVRLGGPDAAANAVREVLAEALATGLGRRPDGAPGGSRSP